MIRYLSIAAGSLDVAWASVAWANTGHVAGAVAAAGRALVQRRPWVLLPDSPPVGIQTSSVASTEQQLLVRAGSLPVVFYQKFPELPQQLDRLISGRTRRRALRSENAAN